MESYLMITQINDFLFCPRSILFHDFLRDNFVPGHYRETPQVQGLAAHAAIDEQRYSSKKNILQGTMVYSHRYGLLGRIDLFEIDTGCLIERKYSVSAVYDGFRFQLYAQKFALEEAGYVVKSMTLYSVRNNKKYLIPLPDQSAIEEFEQILKKIRKYIPFEDRSAVNLQKCHHCNYREICIFFPEEERI